jgi:conjugative transfer signal peptidase TraF
MKPIVAVAGDTIDLSAQGIEVNGASIANSSPLRFDTKDRPLPHWPFGTYRVPAGTVWVISSFNNRSFDSRYFGPISTRAIRHHLRPLITE